jgi:hypothetical protein
MVREEEEGGHIWEKDIIIFSEQGSGIDQVIIKVLIDFLDLLSIFIFFFSNEAHPKTKPQLTNYQALIPFVNKR